MLRILEILTSEPSPVVRMAHDFQRETLKAEGEVTTLDLRGKSPRDRVALLDAVKTPNAIILRGFRDFYRVASRFPQVATVIDACGRVDLPEQLEGRFHLSRTPVICYSEEFEARVQKLGATRVTCLPGPLLGDLREDQVLTGPIRVGFVPGEFTRLALRDALQVREKQGWADVEFISTEKFVGVEQVASLEDVVRESEVLVSALETEDLGEPNDVGILACTFGKGLIAVPTSALDKMGFGPNTYARVAKYTAGGYGAAIRMYMEHRLTMGRGIKNPRPNLVATQILELLRG